MSANPTEGGTVTGGGNFTQGQSCTVVATPNVNFNFTCWTENGAAVSTNPSYTFTVTANRNLVANFEGRTVKINVIVDPEEGGSVTGAGTFSYGDQVTLVVTPAQYYDFVNWTENGDVLSTSTTYTFTANGDRTLVAHLHLNTDGIEEQSSGIDLYPNPVSDKLTVEANEAIEQVEVFSITGAMVFSQKNCSETMEINTTKMPAGTYVIRITTQNTTEVRRFVKK